MAKGRADPDTEYDRGIGSEGVIGIREGTASLHAI
jgi:hypothetical protein